MVFKGGTSLSKVYGLVDRFSEDIDLVLDWRLLGYGTEDGSDPYQSISSKTKQDQYNRAMNAKAAVYIRESLLGELNQLFATVPGVVGRVDESDPHTVNIKYPAAFAADYILSNVRLEIGPLASWVPSGSQFIHPYAAESFPRHLAIRNVPLLRSMQNEHFGRRRRFFIRRRIALARSRLGTRAITMTSTNWQAAQSKSRP